MLALYHKHGEQRGYSGHVLNLPQNTQQFLNQLPPKVNTLPILIVRRHGANSSYVVLKVRRQRVLSALQWLKQNNPFYSDIEIGLFLPTDGTPLQRSPTTASNISDFESAVHLFYRKCPSTTWVHTANLEHPLNASMQLTLVQQPQQLHQTRLEAWSLLSSQHKMLKFANIQLMAASWFV